MFLMVGSAASAEESIFAFVYTTDLLPQGGKEVEQWITWRHQKNGGTYDQLEGRTEFEYGLASNLQAAVYLNYAWTQAYHNGPFGATTPPEQFADYVAGPDDFFNAKRFTGVSGELIYRILPIPTASVWLSTPSPRLARISSSWKTRSSCKRITWTIC
jgi:hypothetical protein